MRVCDLTLKNAWEMTFLFMLNCHATITLVMTKKLMLSIRQTIYLIFFDVPLFVSLISGNQNKHFYFVKVTEEGTAQKNLTGPYGHFIGNGENFLKGYEL